MIDPVIRDWFIAFTKRREYNDIKDWHWWDIFLIGSTYQHCFVFSYDDRNDIWVIIEWLSTGIEVTTARGEEVNNVVISALMDGEILHYDQMQGNYPYMRLSWSYCVLGVKHLLNLPGWWVWTPDQLFRALLKSGARVSFNMTKLKVMEHLHGIHRAEQTEPAGEGSTSPDCG